MPHILHKIRKTEEPAYPKLSYVEDTLYKLDLPVDLHPNLKINTEIEEGDLLKAHESNVEPTIEEIEYSGQTDLLPGTHLEIGDKIYSHKKLFRNEIVTSPFTGTVKEVTDNLIRIEVHDDNGKENKPFKTPFGGKVKAVQNSHVLLEFSAIQMQLFESRGGSAVGPIKYLSSAQIKDRKSLPARVEKCILVTEQITAEMYPMLSTLGVSAVVANSIDYSIFKNMIILAVPIGIITGFGYTPNEKTKADLKPVLAEDQALVKYINSIEGKTVWLDGDYGRLIIPETREPMFLKHHKHKI